MTADVFSAATSGNALTRWFARFADPVQRAARSFRSQRIDYYLTMASRMEDTGGRATTLSMLQKDAQRYAGTPRGVLSAEWARRYEDKADLAAAWEGTLPDADLMIIRVAQASGGSAIASALRDVARVAGAIDKANGEFIATATMGIVAVILALAALAMVPLFFVPTAQQAFSFVPPDMYGPRLSGFVRLSEFLVSYGWFLIAAAIGAFAWVVWSLPNFTHPIVRPWLDSRVVLYKIYRDFRGALFLATISSMVRRRGSGGSMTLQQAVSTMALQADPWLRWHCSKIISNIEASGALEPNIFDTGVLDKEVVYLLLDAVETQGFDVGLARAGERTEESATKAVAKRAAPVRWALSIVSLGVVALVVGWFQASMFEMRDVAKTAIMYRR